MNFLLGVATQVGIFAVLGAAAAWLWNRFGQLSLYHAAAMGTGSYVYARSAPRLGPAGAAIVAILATALASGLLLRLLSRVRGDDYALVSFGIQLTWSAVATTAYTVTGGILGLAAIVPVVSVRGMTDGAHGAAVALLLLSALLILYSASRGYLIGCAVSSRSSELARTLGLNETSVWLQAGAAYGALLGGAGVLWASYLTYVNSESFSIDTSVSVVGIAALCRERIIWSIPAALIITGGPEFLRLAGVPGSRAAATQLVISGIIITLAPLLRTERDPA